MFSYVRGVVQTIIENQITVDVHGVGFALTVPNPELFYKDKEVTVVVHMHWNQEQGPSLFGFVSEYEKAVFLMIIGCPGIGPKIALVVLQKLSPTTFLHAIQTADIKTLSGISGIGPKKAEQLIVQLKHKIQALLTKDFAEADGYDHELLEQWKNVSQVLQSLSYSKPEIDQAIAYVSQESAGNTYAFDVVLRKALSFLAKKV